MRCSQCSASVPDGAPECPQCGAAQAEESTDPHRARGDTDPGRPALQPKTLEQEAVSEPPAPASRKAALRARLGAPKPAEASENDAVPTRINQAMTSAPTQLRAKPDLDTLEAPAPPPPRAKAAPGSSRPPLKRVVSSPARVAPPRRRAESTDTSDSAEDAPPARNSRPKMSAAPRAGQPLVQPGKYAQFDNREPELTMARPELQQQPPPAPPPVNPDEMFQALLTALKNMELEDKLECFGAIAMAFMTFMPWREIRGDGDLGVITTAGFFCLLFGAAVLALMYLRFTGRVPTLPAKLLSRVELGLAALQLPITLVFIVTSIDRHEVHYGSLTSYASMPDFGAVCSLIANFVAVAGAALVMQREGRLR